MLSVPNTAVLYADYGSRASYYDDWLDAFIAAPEVRVTHYNIVSDGLRRNLAKRVGEYDLIVLLHSVNADSQFYIDECLPILQSRRGRLLSFVGNEVNLPGAPMAPKIDFLRRVGADFLATQLLLEAGEYLYADTGARVVAIPHALNPKAFRPETPDRDRPIDIGLRSFRYPPFLGDDDRNRLINHFATATFDPPLAVDISTSARLDRNGWNRFLNSCKGTIANEAGSFWLERDDATMNEIKSWLTERGRSGAYVISSTSPLRRIAHKLPWAVRQWLIGILGKGLVRHESLIGGDSDFEEIYHRFFESKPPPEVYGKCISSRHFDAIGTKTCQIMMKGRYNDILEPGEHYITLKRDLSDVEEAVRMFRDDTFRREMVDRTYAYALASHTYAHRIGSLLSIISEV